MSESRACPECGAEVPAGRLSCNACGALLASVQGRGAAEARTDPETPGAIGPPAPVAPPPPTPPMPEQTPPPMPPPPVLEAVLPPPPPMPPIPGGYLPPSAVMRGVPVTAPAPELPMPPSPAASRGPEPAEPAPGTPAHVPVLELPFAIAPGAGPRLVAGGAALAVVAFVLPWVSGGGVVLGGAFGSGYFVTWGLAAIGNVIPFLLAWVSLALAVLPNPVPRFAALGLLPVFQGGVLAGLGWTYLIGPFGVGIGIWALVGGAFLLVAGGSLVLRDHRTAG